MSLNDQLKSLLQPQSDVPEAVSVEETNSELNEVNQDVSVDENQNEINESNQPETGAPEGDEGKSGGEPVKSDGTPEGDAAKELSEIADEVKSENEQTEDSTSEDNISSGEEGAGQEESGSEGGSEGSSADQEQSEQSEGGEVESSDSEEVGDSDDSLSSTDTGDSNDNNRDSPNDSIDSDSNGDNEPEDETSNGIADNSVDSDSSDDDSSASSGSDANDDQSDLFDTNGELESGEEPGEPKVIEDNEPESEVEHAQKTIDDAQEISDRLAEVAKIIVERFPTSKESELDEEDKAILDITNVTTSNLEEQTSALVGKSVNIVERDPLVLGTQAALEEVSNAINHAKEIVNSNKPELEDRISLIKGFIGKDDDSEKKVKLSKDSFRLLATNGKLDFHALKQAGLFETIYQSFDNWLRLGYVNNYLMGLIRGEDPEEPTSSDISFNRDITEDKTLSDIGYVEFSKLNNAELAEVLQELICYDQVLDKIFTLLDYVNKIIESIKKWIDEANVEEAQSLAIKTLFTKIKSIVSFTNYLTLYSKAMSELALAN